MTDNGWHVDKRVSIGHIVTTAVVAISAIAWMFNIDSRARDNEKQIAQVVDLLKSHAGLSAHPGIEGDIKAIRAEITAITNAFERMDRRLQTQWQEFNRRSTP